MSSIIHIMNPAAGKGLLPEKNSLSGDVYVTEKPGDAVEYLKNHLSDGEEYTIYAYGGDGTLNEVANGIMLADVKAKITVIPVPTGSGNDFYKVTNALTEKSPCDIIKYNGRYGINEVNIGFDCGVAERTNRIKSHRVIGGSFAYILGILEEFICKRVAPMKVTITSADGTEETFEGEYLLCFIGNGSYYGGGFKAAPVANLSDGLLDVILVKNIGRMRFLGVVGAYKVGSHIDPETNTPVPKFADVMTFRRAKKIRFDGIEKYAADGEIFGCKDGVLTIECIPSVVLVSSEKLCKAPAPALK